MLAIALEGDSFLVIENYSDLAAFGTIADLVPLSGVNRTIVQSGLIRIENGERLGIARLMEQAQTDKINAGVVGFRLAPRINAAGRLGSPKDALELLLTEQDSRAEYQAENLSELNTKRQTIETKIYESICQMLESDEDLTLDRVLVVSSENWNPGVIGIVACLFDLIVELKNTANRVSSYRRMMSFAKVQAEAWRAFLWWTPYLPVQDISKNMEDIRWQQASA